MIPVVLLQVAPEHRVLDMCAAPGSKTSQILEALKLSEERGVVVANDLNSSRLDVLLHQTGRIAGAHKHLVVTNYDATRFPLLSNGDKFDRVLCDVMCSGDGTLRKSMDMWPRWNTVHGADLHITQVRVLTRGMMLCKKGGIVVYSTCSLNPVEDEAVVSECLSQAQGSFRLIDPEPLLKDFITVPGQMKWFLLSKDLTQRFATFEEAQAYNNAQEGGGFRYRESMFPSTERLREQNIHFARRVLPHHQDTGGFFFAVMECVSDYPQGEVVESAGSTKQPLNICSATLQNQVRKALNLPESFPLSQIYVRNENAREQKFYLACEAVCELYGKLGSRIVHVGSRVFESRVKYSNDALRFCTQDVGSLLSLLPAECVVEVEPEFVLRLSQSGTLPASSFPSPLPPYPSFLISCRTSLVGPIYIAADAKYPGQIGAKVAEWQQTLVRLTLGLSITDSPGRSDEGDNDCGTEG
uniref:Uncharacterized protein TCIL3000_3_2120 n=1 Tax=Trypanosoma congolense (strain IL3000) TaxID=1068625 RepID=G0UK77_TRYCI|nr:unnamed protein product [Trypanosoma congolense IL3000]